MNKRPFADKLIQPTEELLENVLGTVHVMYLELNELIHGFNSHWSFSKSSGWIQKVFDIKIPLYYLVPLHDSFSISLMVREKEKMALLSDFDLNQLHEQIKNAKRYSEGYALRFLITDHDIFSKCISLINKLIAKRM